MHSSHFQARFECRKISTRHFFFKVCGSRNLVPTVYDVSGIGLTMQPQFLVWFSKVYSNQISSITEQHCWIPDWLIFPFSYWLKANPIKYTKIIAQGTKSHFREYRLVQQTFLPLEGSRKGGIRKVVRGIPGGEGEQDVLPYSFGLT